MKADYDRETLVHLADVGTRVLDRNTNARLMKIELNLDNENEALRQLRADPRVDFVVPDIQIGRNLFDQIALELEARELVGRKVSDVPSQSTNQWALQQIHAEAAWKLAGNKGSRAVTVAVIDSGVDTTHPALRENLVPGYDFTTNKSTVVDQMGHGTHCAGVIGSSGASGTQMSGMSPVVSIMPLRYLNNMGGGSLYDAVRAADFAIEHKADIISASWGAQVSTPEYEQLLTEMVERTDRAGIIFVAAVGNRNRDNDQIRYLPANAQFSTMIAVGATDPNDAKIPMSNFGVNNVHLGAPGSDILSTVPNGAYKSMSGTSMATPLVAGLVALMKAQNPKLAPSDYRRILQETGSPAQMANACRCRIDAEAAVRRAIELR